jgi:hypothetical protein
MEQFDAPSISPPDPGKQTFPPSPLSLAMMKKLLSSLDLKPHGRTLWIRRVGLYQFALTQVFFLHGLVWTLIFSLKINILARNVMSVI